MESLGDGEKWCLFKVLRIMRNKKGQFTKKFIPWNKGLHIYLGGKRFEKGQKPWNAGLTKETDFRLKAISENLMGIQYNIVCFVCGKTFIVPAYRKNTAKYCSLKCNALDNIAYGKYNTVAGWNKGLKCPQWSGAKHGNWKGGITEQRKTWEYNLMIQAVWKRDNYKCFLCGKRGKKLNAHHILPWQEFPEWRFDKKNLVTLCKPCHYSIRGKEWLYAPRFLNI